MVNIEVKRPEPVYVAPTEYVLTLTEEEARTLLIVTQHIGGEPKGRRGHMEDIGRALLSEGLDYDEDAVYFMKRYQGGPVGPDSLYFVDEINPGVEEE